MNQEPKSAPGDEAASLRMYDEGCPNERPPATIPDAAGYSEPDEDPSSK